MNAGVSEKMNVKNIDVSGSETGIVSFKRDTEGNFVFNISEKKIKEIMEIVIQAYLSSESKTLHEAFMHVLEKYDMDETEMIAAMYSLIALHAQMKMVGSGIGKPEK